MRTLRPLLNSSHKSFEPFKYELIPGNPVLVESWLEDHIPYNPAYKPPLVIGPPGYRPISLVTENPFRL